ncbi:MAG TPA: MFS transporter [Ilumatobacteraceae bacterium]|nr:MFS transporter [Ilumatobacteraceae bacterium]
MTDTQPTPRPLGTAFWRIWSAQTVSTLGSSVAGFGIAVHVFLESGNALWLGLLIAASGLPFVVLAPLLGRVDRFDRRAVMITGDSIAAVGTVVALAFAIAGTLEVWHLVIAAVIGGIGTAIQMPAAQAAIPELVDHDQLDRANGLGQIGPAGGIVLAPVIATLLVSRWGIAAVLIVDAVTFLVAVIATALTPFGSPFRHHPNATEDDRRASEAMTRGWAPVFDWMRTSGRGIVTLMAMAATVNLCLGFFNVALVAVVATIDERWAGLPLAVGGISMLGAGVVIGRRGLAERRMPAITLGVFMLAAGCAICGLRPSLAIVAIGASIALAGVPIVSSASSTMLHERVPAAMHGRMFALRGGISRSLDPIGAVVAGVVISVFAEPAMSPGGALDGSFGRVLATGDGRGAALVMILVGLVLAMLAMAARSSTSLRQLDDPRPAETDRRVESEQSKPVETVSCVEPVSVTG